MKMARQKTFEIIIENQIILANDTSQISPALKDLCAKGPLFVPINYD